ncbi:MAG: hypothetical protein KJ811_02845 [Candidatus Margulisbacteria bacterium]|nr:hypothetical protein [Candidatus Margulisiibacteriota bacterium]
MKNKLLHLAPFFGCLLLLIIIMINLNSCNTASRTKVQEVTTTQPNTSTTTTSSPTTTLGPTSGCYIGAFVNGHSNINTFETMIGKNLAVNMWYINWDCPFPSADCDVAFNEGGVPMLTWEPHERTLESISAGDYDPYITTFAQTAKSWEKLVYIRLAHEMNGNWYDWSGFKSGGTSGPAKYIAAWQHVHGIFQSVGATNVKFVWNPNHASIPNETWNEANDYYPGDSYVDWIGLDGYNWGGATWTDFDGIFGAIYTAFASYDKPIAICEFASAPGTTAAAKANWISDAFSKIKNNYPKIKIFCWFNINKERDWRIESSTESANAYKEVIKDTYFLETRPTE